MDERRQISHYKSTLKRIFVSMNFAGIKIERVKGEILGVCHILISIGVFLSMGTFTFFNYLYF